MAEETDSERKKIDRRYSPDIFRDLHMLSPFDMLRNLRKELDNIERGYGNAIWSGERPYRPLARLRNLGFPHMDILDEGDNLRVLIEIPGATKEDLELEMEEDQFRVHAVTKVEKCVENEYYVRCEKREKEFDRLIKLPVPVDPEQAKACFKNDVLDIEVPKKREEKKRTKVAIE
jgi:HSP20 family protein